MIRRRTGRASIALAATMAAAIAAEPGSAHSAGLLQRAAVLSFSDAAAQGDRPVVTVVGSTMRQVFAGAATSLVAPPASRSIVLRAPRWMQPWYPAPSFGPNLCGIASYVPSALLTASAEDRRRLLFPYVQAAACRAGLPTGLFDATLIQESGYNPAAVSPKGAFGLGQLMPATARRLGVDAYDIRQNLDGAARYLAMQLQEFGSPHLALAAYNAGPERVRRSQGVPNITETRAYVSAILRNWSHLEARRRLFS